MQLFKSLRLFPKSLWRGSVLQLIGIIIMPLALLVLIIAIGSTGLHQQAMRKMVGERDMLTTRTVAEAINTTIRHRLNILKSVTAVYSRSLDTNQAQELATELNSDIFDLGLAIYSTKGDLIFSTPGAGMIWDLLHLSPEFLNYIQENAEFDEVIGWEIDYRPILLLRKQSPDQQVFAVAGVTVDMLVEEILSELLPATQEGRIFIINRDLQTVYQSSSTNHEPIITTGTAIDEAFSGISGTFLFKEQGIEYVVSYSPVVLVDWVMVMVEPWEAVATPLLEITRIAPLVLAPVLLISLVGLWFGSQQIVKPLRKLEKQSDSLSEGNFNKFKEPVDGIAEIRRLQTKLIQMAEKVHTSQQSVQEYIGAITEAQEEERRRLARELHDDTIQSMIALKQRVQIAKKSAIDATTKRSLEELEIISEQTLENLRRTIRALRPIYLEDLGLATSLEMLTIETTTPSRLEVCIELEGSERRLSPQVELAFYRIAQEALSNIVRHAESTRATLKLQFDEKVSMIISDNGIGLEVPKTPVDYASSGHFGLMGMYERAELIGAKLSISSFPNQGTHISISYPAIP